MSAPAFLVPLGKYKGRPIEEVDSHYLGWLLEKLGEWHPAFRAAIEAEVARRAAATSPTAPPPAPTTKASPPITIDAEAVIEAGAAALRARFGAEAESSIALVVAELRQTAVPF